MLYTKLIPNVGFSIKEVIVLLNYVGCAQLLLSSLFFDWTFNHKNEHVSGHVFTTFNILRTIKLEYKKNNTIFQIYTYGQLVTEGGAADRTSYIYVYILNQHQQPSRCESYSYVRLFVCLSARPYKKLDLRNHKSWGHKILCQYVYYLHADQVYFKFQRRPFLCS